MDVGLGQGMNGLEVTVRIRRIEERQQTMRRVVVIALTADDIRDRCLRDGCDGFMRKPIQKRTVVQGILDELEQRDCALGGRRRPRRSLLRSGVAGRRFHCERERARGAAATIGATAAA